MDLSAVLAIVALVVALVVPLVLLMRTQRTASEKDTHKQAAEQARLDAAAAKRQAKLERGQGKKKKGGLARMRKGAGAAADDDEDDEPPARDRPGAANDDDDEDDDDAPGNRKDQRKAEKKAERRAQVVERNEQREAIREREAEKDMARKARDAEREAKEKAREEAAAKAKAEADRKKQEEYEQWKSMFSVDEMGEDGAEEAVDEGLLGKFVTYVKEHKVVVLEELAAEFKLKVADVVSRVKALELMGHLTGVVDDRGKYIYITPGEMKEVATFLNKKGRVRISTLAQESNRLIDLTPKHAEVEDAEDAEAEGGGATGQ